MLQALNDYLEKRYRPEDWPLGLFSGVAAFFCLLFAIGAIFLVIKKPLEVLGACAGLTVFALVVIEIGRQTRLYMEREEAKEKAEAAKAKETSDEKSNS